MPLHRIREWLDRHPLPVILVLLLLGSARIVSTYTVFNHTVDEPAHLACGMEWLEKGTYRYEPQHPPLARVAAAIGPFLAGARGHGKQNIDQEGAEILYADHHYDRTLTLARFGILPFFWLASLVVYLWAWRYFGGPVAAIALLLFTFLPPVLAHAGLATTDMALTAFVGASFLSGMVWLEQPSLVHGAIFGACTGLAVLSKFSSLPFIPCAFLALLASYLWMERPGVATLAAALRSRILPFCLAVAVGALVICAGYRFSTAALFQGIQDVMKHDREGHVSYFLGMHGSRGWWYFYPVVLAVKIPLPLLALFFVGAAVVWKSPRQGAALALMAGILVFAMFSHINIGVRHVLPVCIGMSVVAAAGAVQLLEKKWSAWILAIAMVWYAGTSLLSHPDYIPYFNFLAGSEPEKIVADSDLDWGQDMKRLGQRLQEVGARQVTFTPFVVAYLESVHGFPPVHPMDPRRPAPGWNAVSLTVLKVQRMGLGDKLPELQLWPEHIAPTERLGKTTLLWYFPPATGR